MENLKKIATERLDFIKNYLKCLKDDKYSSSYEKGKKRKEFKDAQKDWELLEEYLNGKKVDDNIKEVVEKTIIKLLDFNTNSLYPTKSMSVRKKLFGDKNMKEWEQNNQELKKGLHEAHELWGDYLVKRDGGLKPKEKAEEIFEVYYRNWNTIVVGNSHYAHTKAKECALIHVDGIIEANPQRINPKYDIHVMMSPSDRFLDNLEYWLEVKTEIEKL